MGLTSTRTGGRVVFLRSIVLLTVCETVIGHYLDPSFYRRGHRLSNLKAASEKKLLHSSMHVLLTRAHRTNNFKVPAVENGKGEQQSISLEERLIPQELQGKNDDNILAPRFMEVHKPNQFPIINIEEAKNESSSSVKIPDLDGHLQRRLYYNSYNSERPDCNKQITKPNPKATNENQKIKWRINLQNVTSPFDKHPKGYTCTAPQYCSDSHTPENRVNYCQNKTMEVLVEYIDNEKIINQTHLPMKAGCDCRLIHINQANPVKR